MKFQIPALQTITLLQAMKEAAHAIGHFAATENLAAVYMQNSGLGNAYNPLISL